MKLWISASLVAASLALSACQTTTAIPGAVNAGQAQHSNSGVLAKIASPAQQPLIYFSAVGQYSKTPVAGGYLRKVLGKTAQGGWVAQDFYQDSQRKQTNAFVIFHPDGLRNFDNDVVDGPVIWYRPDGSIQQSTQFTQGKVDGWFVFYDKQGKPRQSDLYKQGQPANQSKFYDAQGHLQMQQQRNAQGKLEQHFWYANGKKAVIATEGSVINQGWKEDGTALNREQTERLWLYLTSLLYQEEPTK